MTVSESISRLRAQREALVEAALEHVPFDGWTKQALLAGAEDLDLAPGEVDRLLPQGTGQAIITFVELTDRKMVEALDELALDQMKIRERIAVAAPRGAWLASGCRHHPRPLSEPRVATAAVCGFR